MKKCPFCAEEIQDDAIVCRHCSRDVPKRANPSWVIITVPMANVRMSPSASAGVVAQVSAGKRFELIEIAGDWFRVLLPADLCVNNTVQEGYVSEKVVRTASAAHPEASTLGSLPTEEVVTTIDLSKVFRFGRAVVGVGLIVYSLSFLGNTALLSVLRFGLFVGGVVLVPKGRLWVKALVGSAVGLLVTGLFISAGPAPKARPELPRAAGASGRTPLDKSADTQQRREVLLQELITRGAFEKYDCGSSYSRVWVEPLFYALDFDQKTHFVSDVYAYCFDGTDDLDTVGVLDAKTGNSVGSYSHANGYPGLKMR